MRHGKPRRGAKPGVTAGLMCAPLIPPAAWTPNVTANAQPQVTMTQLAGPNEPACLPEPGRPATASATDPSPSSGRMKARSQPASYGGPGGRNQRQA